MVRGSSAVERSTVNRVVAGSNPAPGARNKPARKGGFCPREFRRPNSRRGSENCLCAGIEIMCRLDIALKEGHMATVEEIFIAPEAGDPMELCSCVWLIAGQGVENDRCHVGDGSWNKVSRESGRSHL